jgi:hypothetical protein
MTAEQHQDRTEQIRDVAEKKAITLVRSYLKKVHYAFEAGYRNSGIRGAEAVIDQIRVTDIASMYQELYSKGGLYVAQREYTLYEKHLKRSGFEFFDAIWRQYILTALQNADITSRITQVTERTKLLYRELLTEAASSILTPRQVASLFISKRPSLIRNRALRIARTEMTHASALGTEFAANQIELNIGKAMYKVWYHNKSRDYRDTHAALHRKYVAKDDKFNVNGKSMKYPGDPEGGASEVINCRCKHTYATEDVLKEIGIWKSG